MIFLAIAATAADAVTYMAMMATMGPQAELNPFVQMAGPVPAIAMKVSLMVFLSAFAYIIYEKTTHKVVQRRRIAWSVLAVAFVVGSIGAASNIATMVN